MDGQLLRDDSLFDAALFNKVCSQGLLLTVGHHPAHNIAAENIKNHIQIEIRPFGRPLSLGISQDQTYSVYRKC